MTSYKAWLDKGYETLIPIAPPTAEVKDAGKRPAAYDARTGKWYGLTRWNGRRVDDEDPEVWQSWGANLGLVNDGSYFIVDIDSYDEEVGNQIERLARKMLGDAPRRVGQWPKRALLYRAADRIANFNLPYGEGRDRVETTSAGKQIVIAGTHPSGSPYTWDKDVPPKEDLPVVSGEQARAFFERLERGLPKAVLRAGSAEPAAPKDPEELKGDHDLIRRAVMAIPNGRDTGWDDYIALGQAIRGAFGPGYEEEAFEVWDQWAQSWPEGYEAELVRKHWDTMLPSRSLGAEYVLSRAGDQFLAHHFFTPQVSDLVSDMFAATPDKTVKDEEIAFTFKPVSFFADRPIPNRDWVVPNLIPSKTVTLMMGDGGTGKSLLALQLAAAAVTGQDWIGNEVKQGPVVVLSAEDDEDELHRRFDAVFRHFNADMRTVNDLRFLSLAGEDAVLGGLHNEQIKPTKLFHFVEAEVARTKPVLVVFDTLADLFGGNEINRTQTRQFIGLLRGISVRHDCASLLLGHPSVAGMQSGTGSSGSTAWSNSVRSRLYLERIQENGFEPNPDLRRLTTKKANYGKVGTQIGLKWSQGVFTVEEAATSQSNGVGLAKAQAEFMAMLERYTEQGRVISSNPGANYAPSVFASAGGAGFTKAVYKAAMDSLFTAGALKLVEEGRAGKRRTRLVAVSAEARGFPSEDNPSAPDVFD